MEEVKKTLLITGAHGFLGQCVMDHLDQSKFDIVCAPRRTEMNLLRLKIVINYFDVVQPDVVLHIAANVGGIGMNKKMPGDVFMKNMMMNTNLFQAIYETGVPTVYTVGSVCAYPAFAPVPFKENDLWNGYPEETNAGYGFSKRALWMFQHEFRKQFETNGAHFLTVNMYGPNDNMDLQNSHVIAAFVRKFTEAVEQNKSYVECWGTGKATREFLYVDDCAAALVMAVENDFDNDAPVNLGTGKSISIYDLAHLMAKLTGFKGSIIFTGEESDGQMERQLDVSRAKELLDFEAKTSLEEGLKKTIEWYKRQK